jgi:prepilin-type N-terminal cleavage/methylation domain-containing protein
MKRRSGGFSLIEVLITLVILAIVIEAAGALFNSILGLFKAQARSVESNTQNLVGLEMMRKDVEHAGFGLPWDMDGVGYTECTANPHSLNGTSPNPPKAVDIAKGGEFNGSDYLVIRSAGVAGNRASGKWTTLYFVNSTATGDVRSWSSPGSVDDLATTDRVIVLTAGSAAANPKVLRHNGTSAVRQLSAVKTDNNFFPLDNTTTNIVYGITDGASSGRPFNRADFYIDSAARPPYCAPNTGTLVKAVLNPADNGFSVMPLLDCVADMQVYFGADFLGNGTVTYTDNIASMTTPAQERAQLREVRIFLLVQEGRRDANYTHPDATIQVGDNLVIPSAFLKTQNVSAYRQYRWRVYSLGTMLNSLR